MGLFNFDRPVKMKKADDQFGIGAVNPSTFLASKTKENKDKEEKGLNLGIMNMLRREGGKASEFEKIKNEAFGNRSSNITESDTKIASALEGSTGGYIDAGPRRGFVSPEQATKMLLNPERYRMSPSEVNFLRGSMPFTDKVDASKNKIYSDTIQTLGGTEGSLLALANTENRGIVTAAPETKITVPRLAGEGFFSPKNFQKSGSPDATIMTREQMGQALTGDPGYTRFGQLDRPGTQAAKDTAAFNERVRSQFFSPIKADPRSIAERQEANTQSMRDRAAENYAAFKERGGRPAPTTRISGDDTYGTNVMSNPAFGFRSKMSAENQRRYDASATEATRRSEVEPSKGNLIQSVANSMKRVLNTAIGAEGGTRFTKEVPLQTRGEAEQKRYEKYLNRPRYQREATARQEAGITNQMTIDKNREQVRADAAARNAAFQANRRAATVERVARRTPENTGTGRDGTFGAGTTGQGMPSNPSFRGPGNNKAANTPQKAVEKAQAQKAKSGGGFGGGVGNPTNRRGSGVSGRSGAQKKSSPSTKKSSPSTKKSSPSSQASNKKAQASKKRQAAKKKANTAKKSSPKKKTTKKKSSPKKSGGFGGGVGNKTNRRGSGKRGRRCDIRCKYDIRPLTNMNLIKDDLAEVAYFVKELQA